MSNRTRGVQVFPLPEAASGPFDSYALLIRRDGQVRMVHSEGVAYSVTDEKPWKWNDYSADCPEFTPGELITLASTAQPVDLADWVHTFGARLESNFYMILHWNNEGN